MAALKNKMFTRVLIFIIVLGTLAFLTFNENGFLKFFRMKSELSKLDEEINKAENQIKVLQAEIDSLQTNNTKIERVAREKFNMMKKNEKIFKIEEN